MKLKEVELPTYQIDSDWNVCVIPWASRNELTYEAWFPIRLFHASRERGKGSYWLNWNATVGRFADHTEVIRAMHKKALILKVRDLLMDRLYFGNASTTNHD